MKEALKCIFYDELQSGPADIGIFRKVEKALPKFQVLQSTIAYDARVSFVVSVVATDTAGSWDDASMCNAESKCTASCLDTRMLRGANS